MIGYGVVMLLNGTALRMIRERSGHTQASLARGSKVSQGRISELESGVRNVRPGTVKALADALAIPIAALVVAEQDSAA